MSAIEWLLASFVGLIFFSGAIALLVLIGMFWFVLIPDLCKEMWRKFRGR